MYLTKTFELEEVPLMWFSTGGHAWSSKATKHNIGMFAATVDLAIDYDARSDEVVDAEIESIRLPHWTQPPGEGWAKDDDYELDAESDLFKFLYPILLDYCCNEGLCEEVAQEAAA